MAGGLFLALLSAVVAQGLLHAPWVSCFDSAGRFTGARTARTPTITSPDGQHRAYADLQAVVNPGPAARCRVTARLYLSRSHAAWKVLLAEGPFDDIGTGTSLGPVAWSHDSRWLLIERLNWSMDSGGTDLLLYDARSGIVNTPDVMSAVQRAMGKHCVLTYRGVAGFDALDRISMVLADYEDDNGRETFCIDGTAGWLYDPRHRRAQALPK